VRAALGVNEEEVAVVRDHNDANILALGARFTDKEQASKLVKVFLETPFSNGDRHVRRLNKIAELEKNATAAGGQNR
jgi:ribose 5-phosphate isomerase B